MRALCAISAKKLRTIGALRQNKNLRGSHTVCGIRNKKVSVAYT